MGSSTKSQSDPAKMAPDRRGKGEILIVSHAGRGWWDPTSDAKGDVFRLVQRLEPGLNFGHVRKRLRAFAGLAPSFPSVDRAGRRQDPDRSVADRWAERKAVWSNSPTWRYLRRKRGLSAAIIEAAAAAGVLREGPVGAVRFALNRIARSETRSVRGGRESRAA
jgi:hypothetical protein